MQSQRTLIRLSVIASGLLLCTAAVQAQTTVMADMGLGTPVSSFDTDPGQPNNINEHMLGGRC
jgi:hypothetical protein